MVIDFECTNCGGNFENDVADMLETPKPIKCPHCKAKIDAKTSEDFSTVLEDLVAQVAGMAKKFKLTLTLETDDLPGAYATEEEDEDEEEEDDADIDLEDDEAEEVEDEA